MKDPHIRSLLRGTELSKYIGDSSSKVVEELQLPVAKARIDIAVINGHMHGYEIKSASDTLLRLPTQIEAYSKVFDFLSIVTENKYYKKVLDTIPDWVGLHICHEDGSIATVKEALFNDKKDGFYLAKLLWRTELFDILNDHSISFKKKDRNWILCELLAQSLEIETIALAVREKLKIREDWKLSLQ